MKYLKLFKMFEFVKFEQGKMTDWSKWSVDSEIEELESNFSESLFRDINDILDSISEKMVTNLTYDVEDDSVRGKSKLLLIRITFDRKGSLKINTGEFVESIHQLVEYMRENNYMDTKLSITLGSGDKYSENTNNINNILDEISEMNDNVNGATIEFLTRDYEVSKDI